MQKFSELMVERGDAGIIELMIHSKEISELDKLREELWKHDEGSDARNNVANKIIQTRSTFI